MDFFPEGALQYALTKNGAYKDLPFGDFPICIKVAGKIFVQLYNTENRRTITLKCTPENHMYYKSAFPAYFTRTYYCPEAFQPYWITVQYDGSADVPADLTRKLIDDAYDAVLQKLPKYKREALRSEK